ncbi:hypothetical protein PYCH_08750 [Pyrococcus yayanosii CH1]|uniref:Thioredoxin n=1 Tax=Pyrococcus yayanosii (strain CH1 / JCM 16557) TaxID=529709 RepID=F8AJB3_PYRYC|nr:hypothetical protein PYCH_08750 [Pyrococcus yayanosii CH1]
MNVPTLVYFREGEEVARQNLVRSKGEVVERLKGPLRS